MRFGWIGGAALALIGCVAADVPATRAPQPAGVPADWCISTGPDGSSLVLTEARIIPAAELSAAQLAVTPQCDALAPPLPL